MKTLITISFLLIGSVCMAQNAADFFNSAGNQFIDGDTKTALNTVNRGLDRYPNDDKLKKLRDELMKQQEQEQQQQEQQQQEEQQQQQQEQQNEQQQNQQDQNQEKKDQEQQNQEEQQKDQEQKEEEKEQKPEDAEQQEKDQEQKEKDEMEKFLEKLQEMKISREKAEMILEAMKNNEIQYVQQNKRKAQKRKDRSKPDW